MSPMMPSADGNMPSGSGGWGTSGNPDVPGGGDTSELNNPSNMYGSWRDRFRNITGPMDAYGGGPGWSWHRPEWDYAGPMATAGTGQGKQPPQAPPASNDRSTEADRRLADLNNGTGGVNPNGQTGSSMYDDMRNMRAPIGNITLAQDPTGGNHGLDTSVNWGMATWAMIGVTFSSLDPSAKLKLLGMLHNHVHKVQNTRPRVRMAGTGKVANGNAELWLGDTQIDRSGKPLNWHVIRTPETVSSGMYDEVRGTAAGRQGTGFEQGPGARSWKDNLSDWWNNALKNPYAKAAGIVIGAAVTAAVIISTGGIASGLAAGGFAAFLATMAVSAGDYATGSYGNDTLSRAVGRSGAAAIDYIWNAQQIAGAAADVYLLAGGLLKPGLGMVDDLGWLHADDIRFTHQSIRNRFGNKSPLSSLVNDLRMNPGHILDKPIRLFRRNGRLYSLDNRRLYAFKKAGVGISPDNYIFVDDAYLGNPTYFDRLRIIRKFPDILDVKVRGGYI